MLVGVWYGLDFQEFSIVSGISSFKIINAKILQYKDILRSENKLQTYINSSPINDD